MKAQKSLLSRAAPVHLQLVATFAFAALLTGALGAASRLAGGGLTCQRVTIASSSEKSGMLSAFAASYNRAGRSVGGTCVRVTVREVKSGDAERALERGWRGQPFELPDVWSPAGRAWVVLLAQRSRSGAALLPSEYDSLFQSPLVIGMPAPMARALGYPAKSVGWSDVFALAGTPGGWASVGHSEWGPFKLGKTNPTVSTSGLHALIGTYLAAGGDLSVDGVAAQPVRAFVGGVETGVVHYGETSADFLHNLQDADDRGSALDYISAIALEEKELADYDAGIVNGIRHAVPRVPLVPIYPKEGTPVADHPYVVLKSSPNQAADRDFYEFIKEAAQQAAIDSNGFRDRFGRSGGALRDHRFLNPAQPSLVLQPPPGPVLEAMISGWQTLRKRARVLILVDAAAESRSLAQAVTQLSDALSGLQSRDEVGVWAFPAGGLAYRPITDLGPVAPAGDRLKRALSDVGTARGPADLDPALRQAVASLSASYDPTAVDAVLLVDMSPGKPSPADETLERDLRNQQTSRFVRVFTVGPPGQRLEGIALAGRGGSYEPGSTADFLNKVISNF